MKGSSVHVDKAIDENLRGIGKLDYTNRSRLNSTMKKMSAAMAGDEVKKTPGKKKYEHVCPRCGKKFKTNSVNIPQHKASWRFRHFQNESRFCTQSKTSSVPATIIGRVESVTINDYEIKKSDTVAFTTYPWTFDFADPNELKSYVVKDLYEMDNDQIHIEFEEISQKIPTYIFVKNFIKL